MSFWSDASGIVKGVIILGAVGIVVSLLFLTGVVGGGSDQPVQQQRGLAAPGG